MTCPFKAVEINFVPRKQDEEKRIDQVPFLHPGYIPSSGVSGEDGC
jgi:hypothetical protein